MMNTTNSILFTVVLSLLGFSSQSPAANNFGNGRNGFAGNAFVAGNQQGANGQNNVANGQNNGANTQNNGANGINGANGVNGVNGINGVNGANGANNGQNKNKVDVERLNEIDGGKFNDKNKHSSTYQLTKYGIVTMGAVMHFVSSF